LLFKAAIEGVLIAAPRRWTTSNKYWTVSALASGYLDLF